VSIAPWSFSKLKAFETCPKQFYHVKILKQYPQEETEAMRYGTDVHLACEEHIRDGKPIPNKYSYVQPSLDALKRIKGDKLCEYELGLTEDLEPCGFKAEDVWFRGIADLIILNKEDNVAWVVDYKTGKSARYADKGQLELMALAVFKHFPEIEVVKGGLLFVVCKQLITDTYTRLAREQEITDKYVNKFQQMVIASDNDVWNAKPSGLCRAWCDVLECAHNGRN
jgi:RecB family exonuclease|tara:strand:- start:1620 stop:2294 length:675 start_codon:yes stop_codon:yes gene_type:complete